MDNSVFETREYDFLRENENLGNKIGLLTLGGSLAYGTNLPNKGDIDLRGFAFERAEGIIGLEEPFKQIVHKETDTVIYGFNKFIKLLLENNPNTLELIGCRPKDYVYVSSIAQEMIDNNIKFLSKRCFYTFGGYAEQQLSRLENAIARDSLEQAKKEEHIRVSMENAMYSFNDRYNLFDSGTLDLFIDNSKREELDKEIFINVDLKHYPIREFNGMLSELSSILKQYGKLNHRNSKKDAEHLNKHAMHLIRLYLMVIDMLENGTLHTYMGEHIPMLLDIRKGKFMLEDGTYDSAFYDMLWDIKNRYEYAKTHTEIPDKPDLEWVNDFKMRVNKDIILGVI